MENKLDFIWSDIKENLPKKINGSLKITYQMDPYIHVAIQYPKETEEFFFHCLALG